MMLGHFAMGLAAKPLAPKTSLGVLLVSTQVLDILYPVALVTGLATDGVASPWDHGLVMTLIWSALAFAINLIVSRSLRSSIVIGLLVTSHWICDFIAWDRVLPIAFSDQPRVGLGFYNSPVAMLAGDFGLLALGITVYLLNTKAIDCTGKWVFWPLVVYLVALIPACLLPGILIVITGILFLLVLPLGMWVDRHRVIKLSPADTSAA